MKAPPLKNGWQEAPPTEPGAWEMRCSETDFEPQRVTVKHFKGELWVDDPEVGMNPMDHYHWGLVDIAWRKAQAEPTPAENAARAAYKDLLASPLPVSLRDYRRAIMEAVLIGRILEAETPAPP